MLRYKKQAPRLDVRQKLDAIFRAVKDVAKWILGKFLYQLFKLKNEDGMKFHHSSTHAAMVSQFLQGQTTYSPSDILDVWLQNSDGCVSAESYELKPINSTNKPFHTIGTVVVGFI